MKLDSDYIISAVICLLIIVGVAVFGYFYLGWSSIFSSLSFGQDNATLTTALPAPQVSSQEYTNKLPIIFIYDGYSDKKDALSAIELFKETLKIVEPYKSVQDQIITKTFSTNGAYCTPRDLSGKKRIVCADKVINAVNKLGIPHFKTVILSPLDFASNSDFSRGENSIIYISTYKGKLTAGEFKRWMGIVFSQELGHSLGLSYEYAASKPSVFQEKDAASFPNCAPDISTATAWWKNYKDAGYFKGCAGGDNYIYPEQNTLMSDDVKKESYGAISEDYLRGIISCFYGNKDSYDSSLGNKTCAEFKKEYPNIWTE